MCAREREREMKRILFFFSFFFFLLLFVLLFASLCMFYFSTFDADSSLSFAFDCLVKSYLFPSLSLLCFSFPPSLLQRLFFLSLSFSLSLSHVTIYTIIKMLRGGRERKKKRKTNQTSPHYTR